MSDLKYFNVMMKVSTQHRLFILGRFYFRNSFSVAGCIYCKLRHCKVRKGNNKGGSVMGRYFNNLNLCTCCRMILALHMLMLFCIDFVSILPTVQTNPIVNKSAIMDFKIDEKYSKIRGGIAFDLV